MSTNILNDVNKEEQQSTTRKIKDSLNGVPHADLTYEDQKYVLQELVKRACRPNYSVDTRIKHIDEVFKFILCYPSLNYRSKPREESLLHLRAAQALIVGLGSYASLLHSGYGKDNYSKEYAKFSDAYLLWDQYTSVEEIAIVEFDVSEPNNRTDQKISPKEVSDTITVHKMVTEDLKKEDDLEIRARKIKECLQGRIHTDLVYADQKYILETFAQRVIDSTNLPQQEKLRHMDLLFYFSAAFANPEQSMDEVILHLRAIQVALRSQKDLLTWLDRDINLSKLAIQFGERPYFNCYTAWEKAYEQYAPEDKNIQAKLKSLNFYTSMSN